MEKYFLHINEPCTENWESMSTAERGKFCNHCNKTVFDFTTATDAEIVKHIEAMKGEMFCGRFEENQLDRWIERSDIKTSNPRLYKFLLSIILLGAVQGSHAQNKSPQENVEAKKKLDSLLNVQIAYKEIGINPCDTTIKPVVRVVRDSKIIIGRAQANFYKADPLIIVDGVRFKKDSFNNLNTNKIKSVNVLKSAESAAIYGSAGKNGVIIISTEYTKKQLKKLLQ